MRMRTINHKCVCVCVIRKSEVPKVEFEEGFNVESENKGHIVSGLRVGVPFT